MIYVCINIILLLERETCGTNKKGFTSSFPRKPILGHSSSVFVPRIISQTDVYVNIIARCIVQITAQNPSMTMAILSGKISNTFI